MLHLPVSYAYTRVGVGTLIEMLCLPSVQCIGPDSTTFLTGAFSARRLCDTFQTVSQLPLASPSFSHRLDPHWPLCTYDIRGSCRDAKCQYQHASDYQLENVAVLRDLHSQAVRSVSNLAAVLMPAGRPPFQVVFFACPSIINYKAFQAAACW